MTDQINLSISPRELNEKMHDSELPPQVIDVRPRDVYQAGHIRDAVNIPGGELEESMNNLDKKRPIVVYCNMQHPGYSSSEAAAQQLRRAGIQVRVLEGGYPAWEQAGFPVDKGDRFQRFGSA